MRTPRVYQKRNTVEHLIKIAPKATRPHFGKVCLECDTKFLSTRTTAKYCSNACKNKAYRKRH